MTSTLLHRHNPARNERRFYLVAIQPTLLWTGLAVVRTWGRLGGWSRSLAMPVTDEAAAQRLAEKLIARKLKRGYKIVSDKGEKTMTNSNLTQHLNDLADLANQIGAEGIWLIRGARDARLLYKVGTDEASWPDVPGVKVGLTVGAADLPGVKVSVDLSLALDLADAGVLVVMRFPTGDGGEPGIESR